MATFRERPVQEPPCQACGAAMSATKWLLTGAATPRLKVLLVKDGPTLRQFNPATDNIATAYAVCLGCAAHPETLEARIFAARVKKRVNE